MNPLRILTASEQVAACLRGELACGTWKGIMPGGDRLTAELGVGRDTVEAALHLLEEEGLLVNQGARRRRRINPPAGGVAPPSLRIAILLREPIDRRLDYIVDLKHTLGEAGNVAFFATKTLVELGMNLPRIRRLVAASEADAWVVVGGSREVLEWFSVQPTPTLALFGRLEGLAVAATKPNKAHAYAAVARQLIKHGHRRIVLLAHRERRLPGPGRTERVFLGELESHGIQTGPYNLPDWEENIEDFHRVLDSLFRTSPPTALIIDEVPLLIAVQQFLLHRGLRVPQDVSLVCTDGDPHFAWCKPSIAHIRWDIRPVVRRVLRWAANVSGGREDRRQTLTKAEFVEGGTVGPAPAAGSAINPDGKPPSRARAPANDPGSPP
jgi:hypothetical protein